MVVAYARVSTQTQQNDSQFSKIEEFAQYKKISIDERVEEKITSISETRKIYDLVDRLKTDDVLIVAELSRIGRNLVDLISIVEKLIEKKVALYLVREMLEISNDNPAGKLHIQILSSIAEYERALIRQRTKDAIAAKRAAGQSVGRPKGAKNLVSKWEKNKDAILKDLGSGLSKAKVAKIYGMSRPTLDKTLATWSA